MRLIDADKLKAHYAWWKSGTEEHNLDEMKEIFDTIVNLQPTVDAVPTDFHDKCQQIEIQKRLKLEEELKDAVEVVRCKECRHYGTSLKGVPTQGYCKLTEWQTRHDNDYCSMGEKR